MGKKLYKCPTCRAGPSKWEALIKHFILTGHAGPGPFSAIQQLCVVKELAKKTTVTVGPFNKRLKGKRAEKRMQQGARPGAAPRIGAHRASGSEGVVDAVEKEREAREQRVTMSVNEARILRSCQCSIFDAFLVKIVDNGGGRMMIPVVAHHCTNNVGESLDPCILEKYLEGCPHLFTIKDGVVTFTENSDTLFGTKPMASNKWPTCKGQDKDAATKIHKTSTWSERPNTSSSTSGLCHVDQSPNLPSPLVPQPSHAADVNAETAKEILTAENNILDSAPGSTRETTWSEACPTIADTVKPSQKRKLVERRAAESLTFEDWLLGLDNGGGIMLQYLDALLDEFDGDLMQVSAAWNGKSVGKSVKSVIDCIDPCFWDAVGVRRLGHKYLFAHGIAKLVSQTGE